MEWRKSPFRNTFHRISSIRSTNPEWNGNWDELYSIMELEFIPLIRNGIGIEMKCILEHFWNKIAFQKYRNLCLSAAITIPRFFETSQEQSTRSRIQTKVIILEWNIRKLRVSFMIMVFIQIHFYSSFGQIKNCFWNHFFLPQSNST